MIKGNLRSATEPLRSPRLDLTILNFRLLAVKRPPASLAFENRMKCWLKITLVLITSLKEKILTPQTETLSQCHFLCRHLPSAAEEVVGRTAPRLNSRFNADVSCVKITSVSHLHLSTCKQSQTIHHNYTIIVIVAFCDSDM